MTLEAPMRVPIVQKGGIVLAYRGFGRGLGESGVTMAHGAVVRGEEVGRDGMRCGGLGGEMVCAQIYGGLMENLEMEQWTFVWP